MQTVSSCARSGAQIGRIGLWAGLLIMTLALSGCASLWPSADRNANAPVERPDAPPEYDVLVGQHFEADGQMDEATAAYQRALAKDDSSTFLHRKLAEVLARSGRLDEANEHATRAHELDPDDIPTRMFLGQLYRLRRDPTAAAGVLQSADNQPPWDSGWHGIKAIPALQIQFMNSSPPFGYSPSYSPSSPPSGSTNGTTAASSAPTPVRVAAMI